jgi:FkbM family methyltransferase
VERDAVQHKGFELNKIASIIRSWFNDGSSKKILEQLPKINKELISGKSVVVDVGCRWGFADRFLQSEGDFFLIGFDPDGEECDRLKKLHPPELATFVPIGLAGQAGPRTLYLTENPGCSSLLKPDPFLTAHYPALACAKEVATRPVEVSTLDLWAESVGLDHIDHIKIDTQGTELEILQGGKKILETLRSIEVEVEFNAIYKNQPVFSDVDQYLRLRGFRLWKLTNLVHYSEGVASTQPSMTDLRCYDDAVTIHQDIFPGQLYWANAHFVRQDLIEGTSAAGRNQLSRDIKLFEALGHPDVAAHIRQKFKL